MLKRCKPLLGTLVSIKIRAANHTGADLVHLSTCAFSAMQKVHDEMSFQDENSELSRVNATALQGWTDVSIALVEVLQAALQISALSEGRFDISIGKLMRGLKNVPCSPQASWRDIELDTHNRCVRFHRPLMMDLSGIAKGYAVDQAAHCLPNELDYAINAGGDLRVADWAGQTAYLQIPNTSELRPIQMRNAALASSSDGLGCYTIDPSIQTISLRSAYCYSVFAQDCMIADALTKVLRLHPNPHPILRQFGAVGCSSAVNDTAYEPKSQCRA